jgi:hypothetical protein
MQESIKPTITTVDPTDSHESTISRKSNFGDLLISKDEIVELFLEGNNRDFLRLTNSSPVRAIHSPIHGKPAHILREVIPIVKDFTGSKAPTCWHKYSLNEVINDN